MSFPICCLPIRISIHMPIPIRMAIGICVDVTVSVDGSSVGLAIHPLYPLTRILACFLNFAVLLRIPRCHPHIAFDEEPDEQ